LKHFEKLFYLDTLTSIISLWISTMVTITKHVAVHSGCHQSKLIHGSHHALRYGYIMIWFVLVISSS